MVVRYQQRQGPDLTADATEMQYGSYTRPGQRENPLENVLAMNPVWSAVLWRRMFENNHDSQGNFPLEPWDGAVGRE